MTNRDEDMDKEPNGTNQRPSCTLDANTTTDSNTSNASGNWFRSIPRRIRKFISKQSRNSNKHLEQMSNELANKMINVDTNQIDANDYSILQNDNAEEMAMIRAGSQMNRYGWFWGHISRQTAQQKLHGKPNGSFLVRNSQINLHNFTISFRTAGKTLHYRIEFVDGYWKTFNSRHRSIVDLIEDAMKKSKENVFCYVKQSSLLIPPFPVRLTNPISRFGDISSLQNMCRLVIQKSCLADIGQLDLLPLPKKLISYCKEMETIYGEMPIRID